MFGERICIATILLPHTQSMNMQDKDDSSTQKKNDTCRRVSWSKVVLITRVFVIVVFEVIYLLRAESKSSHLAIRWLVRFLGAP